MVGSAAFLGEGAPVFDIRTIDDDGDLNVCTPGAGQGPGAGARPPLPGAAARPRRGARSATRSGRWCAAPSSPNPTPSSRSRRRMLGPIHFLTASEIEYARRQQAQGPGPRLAAVETAGDGGIGCRACAVSTARSPCRLRLSGARVPEAIATNAEGNARCRDGPSCDRLIAAWLLIALCRRPGARPGRGRAILQGQADQPLRRLLGGRRLRHLCAPAGAPVRQLHPGQPDGGAAEHAGRGQQQARLLHLFGRPQGRHRDRGDLLGRHPAAAPGRSGAARPEQVHLSGQRQQRGVPLPRPHRRAGEDASRTRSAAS